MVVDQLGWTQVVFRVPFRIRGGQWVVRSVRRRLACVWIGVDFDFLAAFGGEIGDGCVD